MKGKTPKLVAEDHGPRQAEVVDLMARLRASLEGKKAPASSAARGREEEGRSQEVGCVILTA